MRVSKKRPFFPADMFLLHSSGNDGYAYVETKNLDGETNLKLKTARKELNDAFRDDASLAKLDGTLICEPPNNYLYKCDITF